MIARRNAMPNDLIEVSNAGLLYDRFLPTQNKDPNERLAFLKEICQIHTHTLPLYKKVFERHNQKCAHNNTLSKRFKASNRLLLGLGTPSTIEVGIHLDHLYGTPIIPGTALKGLASHYAHSVWGEVDPDWKEDGQYHQIIFGDKTSAGHLIFHDARITPETLEYSLKLEVITPHHSDFYSGKTERPTDFDSPVPIPFIAFTGEFDIAVSCNSEQQGNEWQHLTMALIAESLKNWGVGAKTSSGYGRMENITIKPKT
jgi:CRISPR-associated protein Cmr6